MIFYRVFTHADFFCQVKFWKIILLSWQKWDSDLYYLAKIGKKIFVLILPLTREKFNREDLGKYHKRAGIIFPRLKMRFWDTCQFLSKP
ncbi:hypothetical protein IJ00_13975 [Calothrix sp. 336/3]|nr:hypothetical protein IJ00_13975 [Calothrix sp. 336/3]